MLFKHTHHLKENSCIFRAGLDELDELEDNTVEAKIVVYLVSPEKRNQEKSFPNNEKEDFFSAAVLALVEEQRIPLSNAELSNL